MPELIQSRRKLVRAGAVLWLLALIAVVPAVLYLGNIRGCHAPYSGLCGARFVSLGAAYALIVLFSNLAIPSILIGLRRSPRTVSFAKLVYLVVAILLAYFPLQALWTHFTASHLPTTQLYLAGAYLAVDLVAIYWSLTTATG